MASTNEMSSYGFQLFESIITDKNDNPKICTLIYGTNVFDAKYKNKQFKISCITSTIGDNNTKKDETTYTSEDIKIKLMYSDIENTMDIKNTINMPFGRFKINNVSVKYKGSVYTIEEEKENEFMTSVILKCVKVK